MKKLNLNIELDQTVFNEKREEMSPPEVSILWIGIMIEKSVNKPKLNPRSGVMEPTATATMDVQRKYNKVMNSLDAHKKGIAELEDDDFDFLYRKFQNQAEAHLQRNINKILIAIDDNINKAKIEKPAKEKEKDKDKDKNKSKNKK